MRPVKISRKQAALSWIAAQRLDRDEPFGTGPDAVGRAVEHLGYVQIDTINVIERCHHHILFNRIPSYRCADLHHAQSQDKSVFEYWTHALSYIPTRDFRYFIPAMKEHRANPKLWHADVAPSRMRSVMKLVREKGPISIREIEDKRLVEKNHEWASRKPSKKALQLAFFNGKVTISERDGMLKSYELIERHFGWDRMPKPATERQVIDYMVDRALRSQGFVSLDSICHLCAGLKPMVRDVLDRRARARKLKKINIEGCRGEYWALPETLDTVPEAIDMKRIHILSPFDPLIIQRKRTATLLGYDHVFEAYVPAAKRKFGYFTLPVLAGDEIIAAIDLKADRDNERLLIQSWHWVGGGYDREHEALIEKALDRFSVFQFGNS